MEWEVKSREQAWPNPLLVSGRMYDPRERGEENLLLACWISTRKRLPFILLSSQDLDPLRRPATGFFYMLAGAVGLHFYLLTLIANVLLRGTRLLSIPTIHVRSLSKFDEH
jgi:hypothetical protein